MKRAGVLIVLALLLMAIGVQAQVTCREGLPCQQVPWTFPALPALLSPTPIQMVYTTPPPTAASGFILPTATPAYCATAMPGQTDYPAKVMSYQPAAYWRLNETSGTTALDGSGNTRHAAISGATLNGATFDDGAAMAFDGLNDYVNLYSTGMASAWVGRRGTISLWFMAQSGAWSDGQTRYLIQFAAGADDRVYIAKSGGSIHAFVMGAGSGITLVAAGGQTGWTHLLLSWQHPGDARLYVNGALADSEGSPNVAANLWNQYATIGASSNSGTASWHGAIAEVAYVPSALPASAAASLSVLGSGAYVNPGDCVNAPTPTAPFDVSSINNLAATLEAVGQATPMAVMQAQGFDLYTNSAQVIGVFRGLSAVNFGIFTPLIGFLFFAFTTWALLQFGQYLLPLVALLIGVVRKVVQTILDFIPG